MRLTCQTLQISIDLFTKPVPDRYLLTQQYRQTQLSINPYFHLIQTEIVGSN
jgi:hypothetical protein